MRRPHDLSPVLSDLNALVLAEIASLGRTARPVEARSDPVRDRPGPGPVASRPPPQSGLAVRSPSHRRGVEPSGEEAEGLFDEPCDRPDPDEDAAADGPTAADLLTPEEQAFIARAVGFLSGRPGADLILDRIWSQVTDARPDRFYDPEDPDALAEPAPQTGPPGDWPKVRPEVRPELRIAPAETAAESAEAATPGHPVPAAAAQPTRGSVSRPIPYPVSRPDSAPPAPTPPE